MIQPQTYLTVADNTGAKNLMCIRVLGNNRKYAKVGDIINPESTVCLIEAMKLFNDVKAEVSGKIVKVMVEDASPVEYEQVLFLVEPE